MKCRYAYRGGAGSRFTSFRQKLDLTGEVQRGLIRELDDMSLLASHEISYVFQILEDETIGCASANDACPVAERWRIRKKYPTLDGSPPCTTRCLGRHRLCSCAHACNTRLKIEFAVNAQKSPFRTYCLSNRMSTCGRFVLRLSRISLVGLSDLRLEFRTCILAWTERMTWQLSTTC